MRSMWDAAGGGSRRSDVSSQNTSAMAAVRRERISASDFSRCFEQGGSLLPDLVVAGDHNRVLLVPKEFQPVQVARRIVRQ